MHESLILRADCVQTATFWVVGGTVSLHLRRMYDLLLNELGHGIGNGLQSRNTQKPETRPSVLAAAARNRIRNGNCTRQPDKTPAGSLYSAWQGGCCMMRQSRLTVADRSTFTSCRRSRRSPSRRRIGIWFCCSTTWFSDLFHLFCGRLAGWQTQLSQLVV